MQPTIDRKHTRTSTRIVLTQRISLFEKSNPNLLFTAILYNLLHFFLKASVHQRLAGLNNNLQAKPVSSSHCNIRLICILRNNVDTCQIWKNKSNSRILLLLANDRFGLRTQPIDATALHAHIVCRCPSGFQAGAITLGMSERCSSRAGDSVNSP